MSTAIEDFTAEEKQVLSFYVSNTDRSIFALTNLPEVIKGALFSRYSRSTLGLRTLLLRDFIQEKEARFSEIQAIGTGGDSAKKSQLAIESAQKFYDRILDGFGDDSIGELGGAHLALENISILATKTVEDARIGGSPLEKSTRYVSFAEKIKGEYRFYQEPTLMNSVHRDLYLQTCRNLFETYVRFTEPIRDHVRKQMPMDSKSSPAAYERSVRARGFDIIRGLLPSATLTNMGVFGNGRFFETLIAKLRVEPFGELNEIAQSAFEELTKVIPSFVRRAEAEHRHFQDFQNYNKQQQQLVRKFTEKHLGQLPADNAEAVRLIDFDPEAETKILAALLYSHTGIPLQQIREQIRFLPESEKLGLIEQAAALRNHRRHKSERGLELAFYTFDILGDYGMYRDLQRHRILTQERQPLTTRFGYDTPVEIEDAGLGVEYHELMARSAEAFETIALDYPEEAQYVVPMSYNIRWYVHINLRALTWLTELRSTPQGHSGYRRIAQEMFRKVEAVQPLLAKYMKFVDLNEYALGRLKAEQRQEDKLV
ncbi:MAG: FAD-dependent thymidylate synthase [SAR324 cluster bacterium]|nr:FAD-dependent thymidylate synthase [SAR324 cluster bacterium]MBL7035049.1 FAD-dependent thymidylate synthase [SAR324 cluster bacterium]